eukprot:scpid37094/ scgid18896/ 
MAGQDVRWCPEYAHAFLVSILILKNLKQLMGAISQNLLGRRKPFYRRISPCDATNNIPFVVSAQASPKASRKFLACTFCKTKSTAAATSVQTPISSAGFPHHHPIAPCDQSE